MAAAAAREPSVTRSPVVRPKVQKTRSRACARAQTLKRRFHPRTMDDGEYGTVVGRVYPVFVSRTGIRSVFRSTVGRYARVPVVAAAAAGVAGVGVDTPDGVPHGNYGRSPLRLTCGSTRVIDSALR